MEIGKQIVLLPRYPVMKTFTKSRSVVAPDSPPVKLDSRSNLNGHFVMEEIWKDVKGYEGIYQISTLGHIRSINRKHICVSRSGNKFSRPRTGREMRPGVSAGYFRISLSAYGIYEHFYIHRLVAFAFIPNPENKPCVNHKDGDRMNNCVANLEWCTYAENSQHAVMVGLIRSGYSDPTRKKLFGKNNASSKRVKVINIATGCERKFNSITAASNFYGIQRATISQALISDTKLVSKKYRISYL